MYNINIEPVINFNNYLDCGFNARIPLINKDREKLELNTQNTKVFKNILL